MWTLIALNLIKLALTISAVYGFGMWIWMFVTLLGTDPSLLSESKKAEIGLFTFHLGICGITASGFLGLLLILGA